MYLSTPSVLPFAASPTRPTSVCLSETLQEDGIESFSHCIYQRHEAQILCVLLGVSSLVGVVVRILEGCKTLMLRERGGIFSGLFER